MNEMIRNKLEVATMQYQNEVNEIHAEKIAKNANPLALVVCTQQYPNDHYQPPKPHKTYAPSSKHTPSTRSHAPTRNKGKEIAKPITPPSESASKEDEDSDPEQAQRDKDRQKNLALIAKYIKNIYKPTNNNLRTSSNTRNKNVVATSPKTKNNSQTRQFGNPEGHYIAGALCKLLGIRYAYHKEKMMLCKQEEKGVPLNAEQGDWRDGTDEEPDEQELEAHYKHGKDSGLNCRFRTYLDVKQLEQEHANQNAEEYEDERVVIANLIANLRLNHDENKKIQKQLKKANAADVLSCRAEGIRRIGNWSNAFSYEVLARIRRISFVGYGVLVSSKDTEILFPFILDRDERLTILLLEFIFRMLLGYRSERKELGFGKLGIGLCSRYHLGKGLYDFGKRGKLTRDMSDLSRIVPLRKSTWPWHGEREFTVDDKTPVYGRSMLEIMEREIKSLKQRILST
ncbi:hypothetical protein Tco_0969898 [Tanacetum coccineum]